MIVKVLQIRTGCRIQTSDVADPVTRKCLVTLTGSEDAVRLAKLEIPQIIVDDDNRDDGGAPAPPQQGNPFPRVWGTSGTLRRSSRAEGFYGTPHLHEAPHKLAPYEHTPPQ